MIHYYIPGSLISPYSGCDLSRNVYQSGAMCYMLNILGYSALGADTTTFCTRRSSSMNGKFNMLFYAKTKLAESSKGILVVEKHGRTIRAELHFSRMALFRGQVNYILSVEENPQESVRLNDVNPFDEIKELNVQKQGYIHSKQYTANINGSRYVLTRYVPTKSNSGCMLFCITKNNVHTIV